MSANILIIEDESHIANGLKLNLEAEGYQTDLAADGQTGLKMVQNSDEGYDLLVLDLMLPGMSGYSVCQTLRQQGYLMPILILSARTLPEDRARGFDVGANQYMTKPFDLDEFLARVRNLLRLSSVRPEQTQDETETSFTFGPNTVNFKTFEACGASGETVVLTVLEMKLLRYFIKRQGEIVSREELQKNVWEIPAETNTRAVDQFIRRLRKIFEPDPSNPKYFVTLRNIGYRFTPE